MLKALFGLLTILVVIGAVLGAYYWLNSKNNAAVKAQTGQGKAVVAEHQAQAAQAAQAIVVRGGARDHVDVVLHQENSRAIEAAPGASAPLGAGFVSVFNGRVSKHPSESANSGQPPVRPADPAQLSDPDTGATFTPA